MPEKNIKLHPVIEEAETEKKFIHVTAFGKSKKLYLPKEVAESLPPGHELSIDMDRLDDLPGWNDLCHTPTDTSQIPPLFDVKYDPISEAHYIDVDGVRRHFSPPEPKESRSQMSEGLRLKKGPDGKLVDPSGTKVIDNWWSRNQSQIGVGFVLIENSVGRRTIRIGTSLGAEEVVDIGAVMDLGGKLTVRQLRNMLAQLTVEGNFE